MARVKVGIDRFALTAMSAIVPLALAACGASKPAAGTQTSKKSQTETGAPATIPFPSGLYVSDVHANTVTLLGTQPPVSISASLAHPDSMAFFGRGQLWIANGSVTNPGLVEYVEGAGGKPKIAADFTIPGSPEGIAFDSAGNLWIANGNVVLELSRASLNRTAVAPKAVRVISDSLLDEPDGLAFASNGDLWVASYGNRVLTAFSAASLGSSHPQPIAHIQLPSGASPFAIAFDPHGNLWVANLTSTVYEYARGSLGTTNTPSGSISVTGYLGSGITGIAFDPHGNLWLAGIGGVASPQGLVYEYAGVGLSATVAPVAHFVASNSSNPGTWALAYLPPA